jgi:hypothetical protein
VIEVADDAMPKGVLRTVQCPPQRYEIALSGGLSHEAHRFEVSAEQREVVPAVRCALAGQDGVGVPVRGGDSFRLIFREALGESS